MSFKLMLVNKVWQKDNVSEVQMFIRTLGPVHTRGFSASRKTKTERRKNFVFCLRLFTLQIIASHRSRFFCECAKKFTLLLVDGVYFVFAAYLCRLQIF